MEDRDVIEAFVTGPAVNGFGANLHIERDCLMFDGWWHAAFRVTSRTFALRNEPPPEESPCFSEIVRCLQLQGLAEVPIDPLLMVAITYTAIDLGAAEWTLWSTDLTAAEADLQARAGHDAFLTDAPALYDSPRPGVGEADWASGIGGLRRIAGLAPLVVLTVGVRAEAVDVLAANLDNCHVESRQIGEMVRATDPYVTPNVVLVDATTDSGQRLTRHLQDGNSERLLPVIALGAHGAVAGADVTLDPSSDPVEWAEHIRNLLP